MSLVEIKPQSHQVVIELAYATARNITGKPVIVFWSYDAETEDLKDYNIHHFVDLAQHFFTKTRWRRTLMLIHGYDSYN